MRKPYLFCRWRGSPTCFVGDEEALELPVLIRVEHDLHTVVQRHDAVVRRAAVRARDLQFTVNNYNDVVVYRINSLSVKVETLMLNIIVWQRQVLWLLYIAGLGFGLGLGLKHLLLYYVEIFHWFGFGLGSADWNLVKLGWTSVLGMDIHPENGYSNHSGKPS